MRYKSRYKIFVSRIESIRTIYTLLILFIRFEDIIVYGISLIFEKTRQRLRYILYTSFR